MKRKDSANEANNSNDIDVRLDKWLWACRFYKTRAIAKAAIDGGKVQYEGNKAKPGRSVHIGDQFKLRQGFDEKIVTVIQLSERRQSASIAQTLYEETPESLSKRQEIASLRKLAAPSTAGKPDKKQRRQIHRFKRRSDGSEEQGAGSE